MTKILLPVIAALSGLALADAKSGHAKAALVSASEGYSPGQPVQLALRFELDDGWHSYWMNPGDSGMPVSIEWTLPEGWVAGPLLYPVPKRFITAGVVGYGYEDEVVMPVFLTPAEDAAGEVVIAAQVDWLTCDASSCVPGGAKLELKLSEGPGDATAAADDIEAAYRQVPQPVSGAALQVEAGEKQVTLLVTLPAGTDGEGAELIAATPNVLSTAERVVLGPSEDGWKVVVPRNEYAPDEIKELEVILTGGGSQVPLLLSWTAEK